MRKFIIAVRVLLFSSLAAFAVAVYNAPAIPAGKDAVITVTAPKLTRTKTNMIVCPYEGTYNYDNTCTFVKIQSASTWPTAGGGVGLGPIVAFLAPEANSLPNAPDYLAITVLPDLAPNTVITVKSILEVSKPNPVPGMPAMQVIEKGSNSANAPARKEEQDPNE